MNQKKFLSCDNLSCLNCGNRIQKFIFNDLFDTRFGIDQTYCIAWCSKCNLEQTIPQPEPNKLKQLYEDYYNFSGESNTKYTNIRQRLFSSFLYQFWLYIDGDISFHLLKGTGKLLDIGCNEGRGLKIYQNNGFQVEGLELNESAAKVAESEGFIIHLQTVEKFRPDIGYNYVILSNVLEHSLEPSRMLNQIYQNLLLPGGQICISCPNNQSWLRLLMRGYWINWHVPFHIVHFSPLTLSKILEDTGFKSIQVRQRTPALWVAHSIIARVFAKSGKPTTQLRNPYVVAVLILCIRFIFFPLLWLGNNIGRGDCLVVTAIKPDLNI